MARRSIRIRFTPHDSLLAGRVLSFLLAQTPLPGIPDSLPHAVVAYLAHTPEAFNRITGGGVPEWRAGVALPGEGVLVIPTGEGRSPLSGEGRRVLRHEWAHLGLHQAVGGLRVPRWFDEGYAQWASGGWDWANAWKLRVLVALGRAPPLDSLTLAWPRRRADAEAAYLLSAGAVAFLLKDSGPRGVRALIARWRERRSFPDAMRITFGVTQGQFEEDWRRYAKEHYGWLFVVSHSAVFWLLMTLLLLAFVHVRKRRNREHMARLRALESTTAGQTPADGWAGGPDGRPPGYAGERLPPSRPEEFGDGDRGDP